MIATTIGSTLESTPVQGFDAFSGGMAASPDVVVSPHDAQVGAALACEQERAKLLAFNMVTYDGWRIRADAPEQDQDEHAWASVAHAASPINMANAKACGAFLKTFCDGRAGRPKVRRKGKVNVLRATIIDVVMGWRATHTDLDLAHDNIGYRSLIENLLHPPKKKKAALEEDEPPGLTDSEEDMDDASAIEDVEDRARLKKAARWTTNEIARLLCILFHTDHRVVIDRSLGQKSRAEQDDKDIEDVWTYIQRIFNSDEKFEHVDLECFDIMLLDPNVHEGFRPASVLKDKFNKVKAAYTILYRMWDTSGRGIEGTRADVDIQMFFERAGTVKNLHLAVIWLHKSIKGDRDALTFGTRLVDASAGRESGTSPTEVSSSGRKRKHGELATSSLVDISKALAYEESASEKAANEAMVVACEAKAKALEAKSARATLDLLLRHRSALSPEQEK